MSGLRSWNSLVELGDPGLSAPFSFFFGAGKVSCGLEKIKRKFINLKYCGEFVLSILYNSISILSF